MLKTIKTIAKQAWDITMKYFRTDFDIEMKWKNDPVTIADKETDSFIRKQIHQHFPEDGILSEEWTKEYKTANNRIRMIDPLDGTKYFIKGEDSFSVIIGLCEADIPILGVIYFPVTQTFYYAFKNSWAFKEHNGKIEQIQTNTTITLGKANIKFSSFFKRSDGQKIIDNFPWTSKKYYGAGSTEGALAEWNLDLSYTMHGKCSKRDICAWQVIIQEAGGVVSQRDGTPLNFAQENTYIESGFITAANPELHQKFIEFINNW